MALDRVPYQVALRTIGAYLDERSASFINVIELQDGFAVRFQPSPNQREMVGGRLRFETLQAFKEDLESRRSKFRVGGDSGEPRHLGGYQDFLRALGYELDKVGAYDVLVEEVEEQVLVTYLQLDPAHSVVAQKRMILLGSDDRRTILQHAYLRRPHDPVAKKLVKRIAGTPAGHDASLFGAGGTATWERGEREIYRTELRGAFTGAMGDHGWSELLVSNRSLTLNFADGSADRTTLRGVTDVSTSIKRDLLMKRYIVEITGGDGKHLVLNCLDREHMTEVASRIEEARTKFVR